MLLVWQFVEAEDVALEEGGGALLDALLQQLLAGPERHSTVTVYGYNTK